MNYTRIYNALIERARNRIVEGYTERHHVVPKCMGGSNEVSNLVDLTPEEHYLAHQLLVKMHPGNLKLLRAVNMMCAGEKRMNNKRFGWIRRKFLGSFDEMTVEQRKCLVRNANDAKRGKQESPESRRLKAAAQKARWERMTPEERSTHGMKSASSKSAEQKYAATRNAVAASPLTKPGVPQPKVECPHCGKEGGRAIMGRYHFNNCRSRV